jgi:hypothetical protein
VLFLISTNYGSYFIIPTFIYTGRYKYTCEVLNVS